jgi:thioredoxin reductase (NADPH)
MYPEKLIYDDGAPVVTASSGLRVRARFVVVTSGIGTFAPRPLDALAGYENKGLAYFVPRPEDYRDRDVVIVGGGDSAFDWAVTLSPIARSVTIVHRNERFRVHEALVAQVRDIGVPVVTSAEVVAALGFAADIGALESWGLRVTDRRLAVGTTMATSLDRVYAAGDITDYPGKPRRRSTTPSPRSA